MKFKIILFSIILSLISCESNKQENNILKIGIEPTKPPFSYIQNNELIGFSIDLNSLIAKELNIKIQYHEMNWAPILPALQNKIIDIIVHVGITEERKKLFDFSNPYYKNELVILFKKNNPILTKEELENKKIAYLLGASERKVWWEKNIKNNALIPLDEELLGIQMLKTSYIDGLLTFKTQANLYCKKNPELDYLTFPNEFRNVGFVMRKNSPLLSKINQALEKLEKNGEIEKLKDKWLSN